MTPVPFSDAVDFVNLGFHVSDAPANRMAKPHRHDDIEITVLEVGWIDYFFGGNRIRNEAGQLCVRWAATQGFSRIAPKTRSSSVIPIFYRSKRYR